MQIANKIYGVFAGITALGLSLGSCTKFAKPTSPQEGILYMPQAVEQRANLHLYLIDSAQDVVFGAAYGGLNYVGNDIPVQFKLDTNLIATYNAINGTSYVTLPKDSYTINGFTSVIKGGQASSDPLWMSVLTKKLTKGVHYMMPFTLVNAGQAKVDSGLTTAYFRIDSIYIRKRDITSKGTLSVSKENNSGPDAGEGSPHLVDNDINTKYLCSTSADFWYQLKLDSAQVVNEYVMTSANDASGRDPKDWEFLGSNDGVNWDTLDVQTGQAFASRLMTVLYDIPNTKAYSYYRVHVTHNNGSSLFQQAEWRLVQFY